MKAKYYCEKCNEGFDSKEDCAEHENQCEIIRTFNCMKCGKVITWVKDDEYAFVDENRCHSFGLGRAGYGSKLDGCDVDINVCDDCLVEWIGTFTAEGQEKIINSGSNCYLPSDVWIKESKGELSDDEYEEHGMYSARQINAYNERFPKCSRVKIMVYSDCSAGSRCVNGASGNEFGECDLNISDECYNCSTYLERDSKELIAVTDAEKGDETSLHVINHQIKYLKYIEEKQNI